MQLAREPVPQSDLGQPGLAAVQQCESRADIILRQRPEQLRSDAGRRDGRHEQLLEPTGDRGSLEDTDNVDQDALPRHDAERRPRHGDDVLALFDTAQVDALIQLLGEHRREVGATGLVLQATEFTQSLRQAEQQIPARRTPELA